MLGREPRPAGRSASASRRQHLAGAPPKRSTAFIVASLCTVLLSPACAGAASEQPADHSTRVRTAPASATAGVAPFAHASAGSAAAGAIHLRLVGEPLTDVAGTAARAAIAGVVQNAYLSAFRVHADATVLPARAVGGAFFRTKHLLVSLSTGTKLLSVVYATQSSTRLQRHAASYAHSVDLTHMRTVRTQTAKTQAGGQAAACGATRR